MTERMKRVRRAAWEFVQVIGMLALGALILLTIGNGFAQCFGACRP